MLEDHGLPRFVSLIVLHYTEVRIHAAEKSLPFFLRRLVIPRDSVLSLNCLVEIALCAVSDVDSVRFNHRPEVFHDFAIMLKVDLLGMKKQFKLLREICFDGRNQGLQISLVTMNQNKIVHIPAIVTNSQIALHEMVKFIEVDIAKQLRSQVANGQATIVLGMKEAFILRKPCPVRLVTFHNAIPGWIVEDRFLQEIKYQRQITVVSLPFGSLHGFQSVEE